MDAENRSHGPSPERVRLEERLLLLERALNQLKRQLASSNVAAPAAAAARLAHRLIEQLLPDFDDDRSDVPTSKIRGVIPEAAEALENSGKSAERHAPETSESLAQARALMREISDLAGLPQVQPRSR